MVYKKTFSERKNQFTMSQLSDYNLNIFDHTSQQLYDDVDFFNSQRVSSEPVLPVLVQPSDQSVGRHTSDTSHKLPRGVSRRFILTIKYSDCLVGPVFDESVHQYLIYQRERGGVSGYEHWQAYLVTKKPMRYAAAVSSLHAPGSTHIEAAKGSDQQCVDYCSKEDTRASDTFSEHGCRVRGQGHRTDIQSYVEAIRSKATNQQLWLEHTDCMARYAGVAARVRADFNIVKPRSDRPTVNVYWGPTSTGKSHTASTEAIAIAGNSEAVYTLRNYGNLGGATLWTGYDPLIHTCVVIDEFYGWARWEELLGWLDKWPVQVRVHNGMVQLTATHIWITSNTDPAEWYNKIITEGKVQYKTLSRRFTVVKHMSIKYTETE